jgi:uncharacterized protein (TIGR03382 family)
MKTRFLNSALAAAMLSAAASWGQVPQISQVAQNYVPITGGTVVSASQFVPRDTYPAIDEGYFALNLGFSFPYFGQTYSTVYIDSNGFLTFGAPCTHPSNCLSTRRIPLAGAPFHNILAPWFADMEGDIAGRVTYKLGASQAEIEWADWQEWGGFGYDVTMKVTLTSSGMIQVHYGSLDFPNSSTSDASAGLENADGTSGAGLLACSGQSTLCSQTNWPANTLFTIGRPNEADLLVPAVTISNLVSNMGLVTFNFSGTIENYGLTAANNFAWKVFLSSDQTLSMGDVQVFSSASAISVAASSSTPVSGAAATPMAIPTGQYYVLIAADTGGAVMEASETNNVGSTSVPFIQGLDLVASTVSGPVLSGPGNMMTSHIKFFNQGADPGGVVTYEILLSNDNTYSTNDFVLHTGTKTVSGGETVEQDVTFPVPGNVPGGEFFYLLRVDPQNIRVEANEMNNVVPSTAKITMQQAELVAQAVDLLDGVTGAPIRVANLGQLVQMSVRIHNAGGADAKNFRVAVAISTDAALSFLSDTRAHDFTVPVVGAGQTRTETFSFILPLNNDQGMPFVTGNYFIFAAVDWTGVVTEINNQNNNGQVPGYVLLRAPAPDLTITRLEIPASAAVGEVVPVYRTIKNVGNVTAPEAKYKFVLSANAIITSDDLPLAIVGNNGASSLNGSVTLGIGQSDTTTELVRLPSQMTPGTYYVGCLVDTDAVVAELDEQNNAWAGNQVNVAASSLRVSTQQLADAVLDRPYAFRLVAMGEQGPSTWTLEAGSGDLPPGLTLSSDGLVSGTPTQVGVNGFNVIVQNASRQAVARLLLRVLPSTAEVQVTTQAVPPVVNSPVLAYSVSLGAAGGVKPYQWKLAGGNLPLGLSLGADGMISGNPKAGQAEGVFRVTLEVKDSLGSRAQRELNVRLVAPGAIVFTNLVVPDGLVNVDYLADIAVRNADGSALAKPLSWTLVGGALPDGLALTVESDVALLSGKPLVAGAFQFSLQVEDAKGRSDTADFVMTVHPARFKIIALNMPSHLRPGETVDFSLSAGPTVVAQYSVFAGGLPPGLAMGGDGHVTGTVADQNSEGTYNFVVEARDAAGASGLGAFTVEVERDVAKAGCSTTGSSFGLGLIGLLALAVSRRRKAQGARRGSTWALAAGLSVMVPVGALAQATGYQLGGPLTSPFVSIATTGTVVPNVASFSGGSITLPFSFSYYGLSTTSVGVSAYGYLFFAGDDSASTNLGIPHNDSSSFFYPQSFIAPWWDGFGSIGVAPSSVRYQIRGNAPRREAVVEWVNMLPVGSTTRVSFQASLFESTQAIRFSYGPTAPQAGSASVGIQRAVNDGIAGLSCTTSTSGVCGSLNYPAGQAIEFYLAPDLSLGAVSGDQAGYSGVNYRGTAVVRNQGGHKASNVSVRFYLSSNATYEASDLLLGDSMPVEVDPFAEVTATMTAPVPLSVTPGPYFLIAQVDADQVILEQSETNNFGSPNQISVNTPAPDLLAAAVAGPAAAVPGDMTSVTRTLANYGNAAAGPFKYTYYLSDNSVVTVSDTVLNPVKTLDGLAANTTDMGSDIVALPTDLPVGRYWLGVCVNYDPTATPTFGLDEISRVNNCLSATSPTIVSRGELLVLAPPLGAATQFAPYHEHFSATGGNGQYTWSLAGGELPVGMTLSSSGDLSGNPAQAKTYGFTVKVASNGAEATAEVTLQVANGSLPLAVVDQDLPAAEFSRAYSAHLIAVGGKPPYVWKLQEGSPLPVGLALATDGLVEGRASASGVFKFAVTVKDSAGAQAAKEMSVRVVNPSSLHVATSRLPVGYVKKQYSHKLQSVGGKPPYEWAVARFAREPENPTEAPGAAQPAFPEGFGVRIEPRMNNEAFLAGVPLQSGLYRLTLKVTDTTGADDSTTVLMQVSYEEGLAIVTTELPDAFVGHDYGAKLTVNLKDATGLKYSIPCVMQPKPNHTDDFECAPRDPSQDFPPGLVLAEDGTITGVPPEQTFKRVNGVIEPAAYSFLIKVTDELGRQDLRGLSIRVRPDFGAAAGCGCGTFDPLGLSALLGLGWLIRSRRTSNRRRNAAHV